MWINKSINSISVLFSPRVIKKWQIVILVTISQFSSTHAKDKKDNRKIKTKNTIEQYRIREGKGWQITSFTPILVT